MEAIRIKKRIESDTLVLPVLKGMIGREVEIIFLLEGNEVDTSTKPRELERFGGTWDDERSADEVIAEIRSGRDSNVRSDMLEWS